MKKDIKKNQPKNISEAGKEKTVQTSEKPTKVVAEIEGTTPGYYNGC